MPTMKLHYTPYYAKHYDEADGLIVKHSLPANVDIKVAQSIVTQHVYPASARTMENVWCLPFKILGNRRIYPTRDVLAAALSKFYAAPQRVLSRAYERAQAGQSEGA